MRILLLDPDERGRRSLARVLSLTPDAVVDATADLAAAAPLLAQRPAVVVADVRSRDGLELLQLARAEIPSALRLGLADSGLDVAPAAVDAAHQLLGRPVPAGELAATIERLLDMGRDGERAARDVASSIGGLASPPAVCVRLLDLLDDPDAELDAIGRVLEGDPALTTRLLKLVNSSYFGLRRRVTSAREAALLLGERLVAGLVWMASLDALAELPTYVLDEVQRRGLAAAGEVRELRRHLSAEELGSAFTAALLRDVGAIVLAQHGAGAPGDAVGWRDLLERRHVDDLGCTIGDLGVALLGLWGLPASVVDGVRAVERPAEDAVAITVHVAARRADHGDVDPWLLVRLEDSA